MATTTATLTLTSDINTDALALTTTHTLNKAGTTLGLEQTTGLAKKIYATAQSNATLISASDYTDNTASRVYIKNTGSSSTDYFTLEVGASNIVLGRLYGQDFTWLPYEGEQDIDISSTGTNMELEFMVINEG
tara:strand:- start:758 stop:1156 length:399 start_codon:yes stop_codon:yes gene_type:complete